MHGGPLMVFKKRNKEIAKQVLSKKTYRVVAGRYDLSRERVRRITISLCNKVVPEIVAQAKAGMRTVNMRVLRNHAEEIIPLIDMM